MGNSVTEDLILDLLEWLAKRDRSYEEVMDAWRTSCPRLPVWEDANDLGLVTEDEVEGRSIVRITPSGLSFLKQRRLRKNLKASRMGWQVEPRTTSARQRSAQFETLG